MSQPDSSARLRAYHHATELAKLYRAEAVPSTHPARKHLPDRDQEIADMLDELAAEIWEGMAPDDQRRAETGGLTDGT